jgi:hypothetical protein
VPSFLFLWLTLLFSLSLSLYEKKELFSEEEPPTLTIIGTEIKPLQLFLFLKGDKEFLDLSFRTRLEKGLTYYSAITVTTPEVPPPTFTEPVDYRFFLALKGDILLLVEIYPGKPITLRYLLGEVGAGKDLKREEVRYPPSYTRENIADDLIDRILTTLFRSPSPVSDLLIFQYQRKGEKWKGVGIANYLGEVLTSGLHDHRLVLSPSLSDEQILFISHRFSLPAILSGPWRNWGDEKGFKTLYRSQGNLFSLTPLADGRIAFVEERGGNVDIFLLDREGKETRLTTSPGADLSPAFSPDGEKMVFVSDRGGPPYLYIKDLKTGVETPFYRGGAMLSSPAFSPNGEFLVFTRWDPGNSYSLWMISSTGENPQILFSDTTPLETPTVAKDNRTIVFSRLYRNNHALFRIDRFTKKLNLLLSLDGNLRYPRWKGK